MKKGILLFSLFCGVVFGQKEALSCVLEVAPSDHARKETQVYQLKATFTYRGAEQKVVSQHDTLKLVVVTEAGQEVPMVYQGSDASRRVARSDFHMLKDGEEVTFRSSVTIYEKEGNPRLSWRDSFGGYHECELETLEGVKLVMKYSNGGKENVRLKSSDGSTFVVLKEDLFKGETRSIAVPLK